MTTASTSTMELEPTVFAEERKNKILDMLATEKKVTVAQLSRMFDVTGVTIRNYLRDLEESGLLTRTHGGAIQRSKTRFEQLAEEKKIQNLSAKQAIGLAALALVEDGDTIVLDTGTTTLELARLLDRRNNLTVVTNDLLIAQILETSESISTVFMGGLIRKGFHCTVGLQGRAMTDGLTADKAFMGANGFSVAKGATTPDMQHAETKKNMIDISAKTILLCDHTKMGRVSFAQFADTEQIDTIVTDQIEAKDQLLIEHAGIALVVTSGQH